jgi:hypothetical protein
MEVGIADHVWSVQELVERALSAEPCTLPEPKPLAPPAPPPGEKPATARELPNGKGWLRVVQGGKSAQKDAPKAPAPIAPTPAHVVAKAAEPGPLPPRGTQMDLFLHYRPKPSQLGLWGDE